MLGSDRSFRAAQARWESPDDRPESDLSGFPVCQWCEEPMHSTEWKEWDGVKRRAEDHQDDRYCQDCYETYSCAGCGKLSHVAKANPEGLCTGCSQAQQKDGAA